MTRQVSLRQISGPPLLAAVFLQLTIDLHVPGATLAIVRRGEVIFARGFGVADVENKTPVTPRTAFFSGSTVPETRLLDAAQLHDLRRWTYADYRLLSGRRVPYRCVESTEMSGRTIYQVERVEVGVELNPSTFTLQP